MQILAVAGMIAAVLTGYPQILLAAGRPRALLAFNVVPARPLRGRRPGSPRRTGMAALAIAVVGVHVAMIVAVYGVLFRESLGIPIGRLVSDLVPAVAGSVALLAVGFPLAELLRNAGAPVPVIARRRSASSAPVVYLARAAQLLPGRLERRRAADRAGPAGGARTVRLQRLAPARVEEACRCAGSSAQSAATASPLRRRWSSGCAPRSSTAGPDARGIHRDGQRRRSGSSGCG